jgi:hypothetical protein
MSEKDADLLLVGGKRFWKEKRWSRDKNIHYRTTNRHRQKGLPWLLWGNEVYIPELEGDEYIASQVTRRNPPRRNKRQAANSGEINAT